MKTRNRFLKSFAINLFSWLLLQNATVLIAGNKYYVVVCTAQSVKIVICEIQKSNAKNKMCEVRDLTVANLIP